MAANLRLKVLGSLLACSALSIVWFLALEFVRRVAPNANEAWWLTLFEVAVHPATTTVAVVALTSSTGLGSESKRAIRLFPLVFLAEVTLTIVVAAGLILFVVPGVILAVRLQLIPLMVASVVPGTGLREVVLLGWRASSKRWTLLTFILIFQLAVSYAWIRLDSALEPSTLAPFLSGLAYSSTIVAPLSLLWLTHGTTIRDRAAQSFESTREG